MLKNNLLLFISNFHLMLNNQGQNSFLVTKVLSYSLKIIKTRQNYESIIYY